MLDLMYAICDGEFMVVRAGKTRVEGLMSARPGAVSPYKWDDIESFASREHYEHIAGFISEDV